MFFVIWGEHTILSQIAQRETTLDYFNQMFFLPPPSITIVLLRWSRLTTFILQDKRSSAVIAVAADRASFLADDFAFDLSLLFGR